jgi:hypothetical protein
VTAPVIQLSDRQATEPRMEATVFVHELDQRAKAAHTLLVQGDLIGTLRAIKGIEGMVPVALKEIDELTRHFGYPEGDSNDAA